MFAFLTLYKLDANHRKVAWKVESLALDCGVRSAKHSDIGLAECVNELAGDKLWDSLPVLLGLTIAADSWKGVKYHSQHKGVRKFRIRTGVVSFI